MLHILPRGVINIIYLDNAATTKPDERVINAMLPYLKEEYGNAGAAYKFGRQAREAVEEARKQVAVFMGAAPEQIIFTSGGSESNNTVFKGVIPWLREYKKNTVIISNVEHDSVNGSVDTLKKEGFNVVYVPVSADGTVNADTLLELLTDDVGLVSIMYVNNEIGSVNPVKKIGKLCNDKGILFHTDCVQAAGNVQIDVKAIGCDFASISSHKIHGPKGVGALFVRNIETITPLVRGGENQEFGWRGGTENVPGIVGFGVACCLSMRQFEEDNILIRFYSRLFLDTLIKYYKRNYGEPCIKINCAKHIPKILNLRVEGVDAESLVLFVGTDGVCISAGSACRSLEAEPSKVLLGIGLSPEEARNSIRVSFSRFNSSNSVIRGAQILADAIAELRNCVTAE